MGKISLNLLAMARNFITLGLIAKMCSLTYWENVDEAIVAVTRLMMARSKLI